jgi:hydrogenase nickel incorporation protein HypB
MCTTCGCSDDAKLKVVNMQTGKIVSIGQDQESPSGIKGGEPHTHVHTHSHFHGSEEHSHEHEHTHSHEHDHPLEHDHVHSHEHDHMHTHVHTHPHFHGSEEHSHEHTHEHSHPHSHEHSHSHSHDHEHDHSHDHEHDHSHDHEHAHSHDHEHAHSHERASALLSTPSKGSSSRIDVSTRILEKNDRIAASNRTWLKERSILTLNIVSAPGAGKTALLEATINSLKEQISFAVLEGDQATLNDARRIQKTGCPVVQINTGPGCHLDAEMVATGLDQLRPQTNSILMVENVGNLVCPALFDIGETCKVALLSVTEGEDKPSKYPHMFRAAELLLLNKIDLLPHLNFDLDACKKFALAVNPSIKIVEISATKGDGMEAWYDWLKHKLAQTTNASPLVI